MIRYSEYDTNTDEQIQILTHVYLYTVYYQLKTHSIIRFRK